MEKYQPTPVEMQQGTNKQTKDTDNSSDNKTVELIIPANTKLDTSLTLPTWGIPHLEYYIDHITEIYNCPRDYVVFCVMSAVGTAIGTQISSYDGKHHNSTQLWGMIIGEQGCSKSEPLNQAFKPLYQIDLERYEQYKEELKNWTEGNPKPSYNHTLLGDCTPEYKHDLLSRNKRGTNYIRDEIACKFAELNRYNSGSDVETELSIFNHYQITINRKSGEPIVIPHPYMSQIGTIQPDILVKYIANDTFLNNGYLARWLFVLPENQVIPYYSDKALDEKIVDRYNKYIRYISSKEGLGTVLYTDEAKKLYIDYYNELRDKIEKGEDNFQKGIYSKLQIHVQRWALVTLTARLFEVDERMEISGDIMRYSIECMRYFESTAMKVRNLIYRNRNLRNQPKEIGKSDVLRKLVEFYPQAGNNKQQLADILGISRPQVSRELNKPL